MEKNKQSILEGLNEAAEHVISSLGPKGRKVALVNDKDPHPKVSQDGVTICRSMPRALSYKGHYYSFGAKMLTDAANTTVRNAGDGTTTTCLIARDLIQATENENVDIINDLKDTAKDIIDQINSMSRKPTIEELRKMAIVTSRSRASMATELADMVWELGSKSHIQSYFGYENKIEIKKGYEFNNEFLLPIFWRWNQKSPTIEVFQDKIKLNDPFIVLIEEKISSGDTMVNILNQYANKGSIRPLVLMVSDIEGEALDILALNFSGGQNGRPMPVFPIKAPESGMKRVDMLDDIKAGVGGKVFSKYNGTKIKNFEGEFGEASSITVFRNGTTHITFKDAFKERIEKRASQVEDEERKSKLTKGVGIISMYAPTEVETKEMAEVVEDVVRACQTSLEHGVVPGSGYVFRNVKLPETRSGEIFGQVFESFFKELTAQSSVPDGEGVFNIMTEQWESPEDTAIFDSCKSITESITNSVSLAGEIISLKHAVYVS